MRQWRRPRGLCREIKKPLRTDTKQEFTLHWERALRGIPPTAGPRHLGAPYWHPGVLWSGPLCWGAGLGRGGFALEPFPQHSLKSALSLPTVDARGRCELTTLNVLTAVSIHSTCAKRLRNRSLHPESCEAWRKASKQEYSGSLPVH